jgi:hypothetical protein
MIRRVPGGFKVQSHTGKMLSRRPKSKSAAVKQLVAVEMSKKRRGEATMPLQKRIHASTRGL